MSHAKFHHPNCLNCHYPLAEFDKFCPNCGQKPVAPKAAMHDLIHEFVHTNFHLDGKFFSTLKHIFLPGKLTEEFFKGHRKRYAHPIQLYLVLGGLFLLIMTSIAGKAEAKFQKQLDQSQSDRKVRRLLTTLDSSAQEMTAYKEDPSVKKAIDSLLMQQFLTVGKRTEITALRQGYVECKETLFTQQLKIIRFREQFSPELTPETRKKMDILLRNYEKEYEQLQNDSATLVRNYSELERSSERIALSSLESFFSGNAIGKKIKGEDGYDGKWLKDAEDAVKKDIKSDLEAKNDSSKTFMEGFNDAKRNKKDSSRENVEKVKDFKTRLKKPDSAFVVFFTDTAIKVSQNDLLDFESDEIIKKYKIEGFWSVRFAKRFILMRQQGGAMMHTFFGKFLWIITFSLLPTAAFMYLLYWRQKRYFAEHVVWLLHLNCLIFILFPLVGIAVYQDNDFSDWIIGPFLLASVIAPFFALKRYYKQSWGKTIVKGFIFQMAYSIIGTLAFLLGGAISFLFL